MYSEFESILKSLFLKRTLQGYYTSGKSESPLDEETCREDFRKILDKVAIGLIYNAFENEKYIAAMLRLARLGRIIIAFNVILEMELSEIAYLLDTTPVSVHTQKYKALKRLKAELENVN